MDEEKHSLFNKASQPWHPNPSENPSLVSAKGLSAERRWYLFDSIRQFCPDEDRDITCPKPSFPKPGSRASTPLLDVAMGSIVEDNGEELEIASPQPSKKKSRRCSNCKKEGHNLR